jgi:hypothetical protein
MGWYFNGRNPTTQVSKADMTLSEKQQLVAVWKYRTEVMLESLTMNGVSGADWQITPDDLINTYSACLVKDGQITCNYRP